MTTHAKPQYENFDSEFACGGASIGSPSDVVGLTGVAPQENSIQFCVDHFENHEILRLTNDGVFYKGEFVKDAGEAYKAWMDVMGQMGYQKPLTDDEIQAIAERHLGCDDPHYTVGNDGILGWLEFARAVLKG